jgi:hypothetical protein
MIDDADSGRVPSPSNDEMTEIGAPVAIGTATRVVEGIRDNVTDGMFVIAPSKLDTTEEASLGRAGFSIKDDNCAEACGKIVAWEEAARIEETRDRASLGRPVPDTASEDRTEPAAPLGICTAPVGVEVPRTPILVTPPSNSETADEASLGKAEF